MFQYFGHLGQWNEDICREDIDLLVTSCGCYRLITQPVLRTARPEGRGDYQLLFTAKGRCFFQRAGECRAVSEGEGILYSPGESQDYWYCLEDKPEIYWMHFTGGRVKELLAQCGLEDSPFRCGLKGEYGVLFERMIRELQLRRPGFSALCNGLGMELLSLMGRAHTARPDSSADEAMEQILARFHQDFRKDIQVEGCAKDLGMSESWFIRRFKERTGMTPQRYLTEIRLNQAKELLSSSSLNIGEIAELSGYENALYFSRIFRKYTGLSPSGYRKQRNP